MSFYHHIINKSRIQENFKFENKHNTSAAATYPLVAPRFYNYNEGYYRKVVKSY